MSLKRARMALGVQQERYVNANEECPTSGTASDRFTSRR